ncbi:MAG TPA: DUF455 family protein [Thermoanaerobaculia bacterium]|nr:DUF455 family protein [Thermoanaerobaculia bacterium]
MTEIGYFDLNGIRLRAQPARDECFAVVRDERDMAEFDGSAEAGRREMLHRHMSNEITSLDIAAQCLIDFPETPWPLRMELARQCWDEARHVRVLKRRLLEIGGHKGEFPISTFEWSITSALDTLAARLATQNRTFEAGAMDVVAGLIRAVRESGDDETAYVLDGILADEVQHVRFANRWIKTMSSANPRLLLKIAQAIRFLARANEGIRAKEGEASSTGKVFASPEERVPAVNVEDRQRAEFTEDEILEILKQAGFRTILPGTPAGAA